MSASATKAAIMVMGKKLADPSTPIAKRFRTIFTFRSIGGNDAVNALVAALDDDSALLKHEICFALGQMQNPMAIPYLEKTLRDVSENSMVRHEAGEALGAIGLAESIPILEEFAKDSTPEVSETCQLALDRIRFYLTNPLKKKEKTSLYVSVDPAPPTSGYPVPKLREILLDTKLSLFERYGAMFGLRNIGGKEAIDALAEGLNDSSALVRHEIAYILGQMQDQHAVKALSKSLATAAEHPMVRHEAAEALGAIGSPDTVLLMRQFAKDSERVVKESCIIALDVFDYVNSDEFEYADALKQYKENM